MFMIGDAAIEDQIRTATFRCDLERCMGACCTLPGARGAPLLDGEVSEVARSYSAASKYLSAQSISAIEGNGLVEGSEGNYATRCIDQRDCVFVFYENRIAKCSLEKAFEEGTSSWRKPLSCHLFPIRIRRVERDYLRYEQIDECQAGRERGAREQTSLLVFLRDALTRKFGESWYGNLVAHCGQDPPAGLPHRSW